MYIYIYIWFTIEQLDFSFLSLAINMDIIGNSIDMPIPVLMPTAHLFANQNPGPHGPATENGCKTETSTDPGYEQGAG